MNRLFVVALVIAAFTETQAQPPQAKTTTASIARTGSVEGRVLGITQGGDLKPARIPSIYLLYKGPGDDVEDNSADMEYQHKFMDALKNRPQNFSSTGDENLKCRESLLEKDRVLLDTAQWALGNKKGKQVLTTEGDEEGYFSIKKVPAGTYRIVARGQAGANDAYWESKISVKLGTTTSVKLTSPGQSCLRVE